MSLKTEERINIIQNFGLNSKDTGSTVVQIALLNARINYLHSHFMHHKKDRHGRRGLLCMVSRRRKLLNYLRCKNLSKYIHLIDNLGLRR